MKSSETYPTAFAEMLRRTQPSIVSHEYSIWLTILLETSDILKSRVCEFDEKEFYVASGVREEFPA